MPDLLADSRELREHIAVELRRPTRHDGAAMWRLARDSGTLDLNSSYAYLLWGRDFSATSVVADHDGRLCGLVTGYRRPDHGDTLMVWQVAVDAAQRGRGVARRMLDRLLDQVGGVAPPITFLETTVTADNTASIALFTSLARRHHAELTSEPLFRSEDFPDRHATELLLRIGPFPV